MEQNGTPILKRILFPILSIFLIVQSYKLFKLLDQMILETVWSQVLMAWLLNLFVTGIFAFTGFAYPTQKLLSDKYYQVKNPNILKRVFKYMGVDVFRKFLLATFWRDKKMQKKFFDGKKTGFEVLDEQTKKSEFGHLCPFVILTIMSVYYLVMGNGVFAFFVMLWNILGNLYPIILQRHHRMRLQRILNR